MRQSLFLFLRSVGLFYYGVAALISVVFFVLRQSLPPFLTSGMVIGASLVILLVGSFRAFHRLRVSLMPRELDLEMTLSGVSLSEWRPSMFTDSEDNPGWWVVTLHGLQITNRSPSSRVNLTVSIRVPSEGDPLVPNDEPYDMFRRAGEAFHTSDHLPNPIHLDPQSTRKGAFSYPLLWEKHIELVKATDLRDKGELWLRNNVTGADAEFRMHELMGREGDKQRPVPVRTQR